MSQMSGSQRQAKLFAVVSLFIFASFAFAVPAQTQSPTLSPTQTYTFLSSFTGNPEPQFPVGGNGLVQGRDGNFYGGSYSGGVNNDGSIFKVTRSGTISVIYSLTAADGGSCYSTFTLGTDGNFYGVCAGGNAGDGFVFKVTPAGVFTKLHSFTGVSPDGNNPTGLTLGTDGNFYGTTVSGGTSNLGTFFRITPAGALTTLYSFTNSVNQPNSGLIQGADGNFYGTGTPNATNGVIFKITTTGVLSTLHTFVGSPDGSDPAGVIQGKDGNFYGVTRFGGSTGQGIVFKMTAAGTFTILHNFNQSVDIAGWPVSPLVQGPDGNFYAMTCDYNQFNSCGGPGHEAIYEITPTGTYSTVHVFAGPPNDGQQPFSTPTVDTDGTMYGFTEEGGSVGDGAFFSLNIGGAAFISLVNTSGKVGTSVGILGQGLSASSVVKFNGVTATSVTRTGTTYLAAKVPAGASDGYVTVTTGTTVLTSSKKFTVHNSWASGKVMPTALNFPVTGVMNGKIYVVGGYTAGPATAANQIYNPVTNTWSTGAAIPAATAQAAAAVVSNILYVFGGSNNGGGTVFNTVWAYNPSTNSWSAKTAMPTARADAAAVVSNGIIYVIGGYNSGNRLTTVEAYDPATNSWTSKMGLIAGKTEISAGLIGGTIVAADGFTSSGDTGDNEGYDVATNTWSSLAADPTARNSSCSGAIGSLLFVSDGHTNVNSPISLMESFSLAQNKWTTLMAMPQTVTDMGSAIFGGQLYCMGGGNNAVPPNNTVYNYVQIYQP